MELQGQRVVITGASSGIGRVTAMTLAAKGAKLVLAGRSEAKTLPIVDAICAAYGEDAATFLPVDLASMTSVRRATQTLLNQDIPIKLLINNAGVGGGHGITEDGFEAAFGTNHLGHFLFTLPLLPLIVRAPNARIITVASEAHYMARRLPLDRVHGEATSLTKFPEYAASKLANVLFSEELGERLRPYGVHTYAVHPGVVATNIWREVPLLKLAKVFMLTEEAGAQNTLYCALSDDVRDQSGLYYEKKKPRRPSRLARNEALRKELWARSEVWADIAWSDLQFDE